MNYSSSSWVTCGPQQPFMSDVWTTAALHEWRVNSKQKKKRSSQFYYKSIKKSLQWFWQMFLASKLWKLICYWISVLEMFYTVILSNNFNPEKNKYRDILHLIAYTLNISNPFLQHALLSLQVELVECEMWRTCVLFRVVMLLFLMPKMRYVAFENLVWRQKFSLVF